MTDILITRISSRLDRTARCPGVGGDKKPQTDTRAHPKSVCPAPHTDGWTGVVTQIGPHGGQHAQAVFESDCESKSVKWAKSPGQTSGRTDKQTDRHS